MIYRIKIFFAMALIAAVLVSCKKDSAQVQVPRPEAKAQTAQTQTAQTPQAASEPASQPSAEAAKSEATIDARRRNPFQSYIILMKGVEGGHKVKGPLECCELALFKVMAVVAGGDSQFALVQAPDNKRYIVKKGDLIGSREGRVVVIDDNGITVRETIRDDRGNVRTTVDTVITLRGEKESGPHR